MSGRNVANFNQVAIRGPRPGLFVGDCVSVSPHPIVKAYTINHNIPPSPKVLPLGTLTRLPTEIVQCILSLLDVFSVLDFRNVNQRAADVVTSSHEFEIVMSFPKAMSTVVTMQCRYFSLGHLAGSLSDPQCSKCKIHFGELLCLITAERVCW